MFLILMIQSVLHYYMAEFLWKRQEFPLMFYFEFYMYLRYLFIWLVLLCCTKDYFIYMTTASNMVEGSKAKQKENLTKYRLMIDPLEHRLTTSQHRLTMSFHISRTVRRFWVTLLPWHAHHPSLREAWWKLHTFQTKTNESKTLKIRQLPRWKNFLHRSHSIMLDSETSRPQ